MTLDDAKALDASDPLAFARERFVLPRDIIYLDGNSLGGLPANAAARVSGTVQREWGEGLITSWNKVGWIEAPFALAVKLAPIVGAGADELLVTDSTSINLFKLLAAALGARPGRKVILTERGNFPTDLYMAQGLAALCPGVEVRAVPTGEIDAALDDNVAVLMLTHVPYLGGERHDMKARTEAAHAAGALALWDLSHSAGAIALDLAGSGADLAVGCGYKYLNGGPGAPAFLFVARRLQEQLQNPLPGWMGHAAPFDFDAEYRPRDGIGRFLTGTPPIVAMAALEAGLATFEGLGMADIEAKSQALSELMISEVEARYPGVALASSRDPAKRGSHVVFAHPEGYAVMQALIARGVIGDFRTPDLIRFGFAPLYNRFEEVWHAVDALAAVIKTQEWKQPRFTERAAVT